MEIVIDRQAADDLAGHFSALSKLVPLRPIRTEVDYDSAVASLNALLDSGAADETHPLADLAATLSGKRELNLRQMRALAGRFSVPVAAFVDGMHAAVAQVKARLVAGSLNSEVQSGDQKPTPR